MHLYIAHNEQFIIVLDLPRIKNPPHIKIYFYTNSNKNSCFQYCTVYTQYALSNTKINSYPLLCAHERLNIGGEFRILVQALKYKYCTYLIQHGVKHENWRLVLRRVNIHPFTWHLEVGAVGINIQAEFRPLNSDPANLTGFILDSSGI
jgi:hypothetical protein